jgi:hypothetical protein
MIVVVFRSRLKPGFDEELEFESLETLKAWRERFFESYRIQVCRVERDYAFP